MLEGQGRDEASSVGPGHRKTLADMLLTWGMEHGAFPGPCGHRFQRRGLRELIKEKRARRQSQAGEGSGDSSVKHCLLDMVYIPLISQQL